MTTQNICKNMTNRQGKTFSPSEKKIEKENKQGNDRRNTDDQTCTWTDTQSHC